jgi:hypothetical protein
LCRTVLLILACDLRRLFRHDHLSAVGADSENSLSAIHDRPINAAEKQ